MDIKGKHLKHTIYLLLSVPCIAYLLWALVYTLQHKFTVEDSAIGVLSIIGFVLFCISGVLVLMYGIFMLKEFIEWLDDRKEITFLRLHKPNFPSIRPAVDSLINAAKKLLPKGKPVIKEFDDEDS